MENGEWRMENDPQPPEGGFLVRAIIIRSTSLRGAERRSNDTLMMFVARIQKGGNYPPLH